MYSKPIEETTSNILDIPIVEPIIQPQMIKEEQKVEIPLQRCIYKKNGEIQITDICNTDQFKVIDKDNSIYECNIHYKYDVDNDMLEKLMYSLFIQLGETPKNPCFMCESYKSCRKSHPTRKYLTGCGSFKINRKMELEYGYLIPNLDLVEIYKDAKRLNSKTLQKMADYTMIPLEPDGPFQQSVLSFSKYKWIE